MQLQLVAVFCVFAALLVVSVKDASAATTVRPYEFGFRLDDYSQQHRSEKRDERGIVMGEFGFITADGIYHVTVYATDEDGKFRILAMRNFPYEKQPKTIDMIVAAKPKPKVIAVAPAAPTKKTLPAFNFGQEACSGCFLTNKAPKQKTEIRTLSQPLPPSPPENSITGTGAGKELVSKALPKILNNLKQVSKSVQSPIRPTIEDTIDIAQLARVGTKTQQSKKPTTPTPINTNKYTQHNPQTAKSQVRYATAIVAKDNLGRAQVRLTDVTNKKPKLVKDNLGQPQRKLTDINASASSNNVAKFGKPAVAVPATLTNPKNAATNNLGQPQRRLTTVPNAVPRQPNLTKNNNNNNNNKNLVKDNIGNPQRRLTTVPNAVLIQPILTNNNNNNNNKNLVKDNIDNPQRRLTTINTNAPAAAAAAARITTGSRPAGAVFGQPPKPQTPNKKSLIPPTHTTATPKTQGTIAAPPGGKLQPPVSPSGTARTQPGQFVGSGKIDPRFSKSPSKSLSPSDSPQIDLRIDDSSSSNPSAKKPTAAGFPQASGAPSGAAGGFGGGKPSGAAGANGFGGGKTSATSGDAGDLYRFKYTLDYNGHQEKGSRNGDKQGSFFSIGDDNIERTIEYIANEFGFQPRIRWRKLDAPVKPKENTLKDYEFVWFKE